MKDLNQVGDQNLKELLGSRITNVNWTITEKTSSNDITIGTAAVAAIVNGIYDSSLLSAADHSPAALSDSPQAAGTTAYYIFGADSDGVKLFKAPDDLDAFPLVDEDYFPLACLKVVNANTSGEWTAGDDNWDASNITTTICQLMGVVPSGRPSDLTFA